MLKDKVCLLIREYLPVILLLDLGVFLFTLMAGSWVDVKLMIPLCAG